MNLTKPLIYQRVLAPDTLFLYLQNRGIITVKQIQHIQPPDVVMVLENDELVFTGYRWGSPETTQILQQANPAGSQFHTINVFRPERAPIPSFYYALQTFLSTQQIHHLPTDSKDANKCYLTLPDLTKPVVKLTRNNQNHNRNSLYNNKLYIPT